MREMTVTVGDGFADLADARGVTAEELAAEACGRLLAAEADLVRREALRLARVHDSLLRRLGE
ncbi:hypothetical protein [Streptomyces sp. adm13(2018)]|uniref:hypothetical protein n=1 Tax=Streptomyces sp. adm13(2018) TaxID=2479007 RepID=UPI0011CD8B3F|nr:hypothetical protein [Streptomyces sp. adm13(2018)]